MRLKVFNSIILLVLTSWSYAQQNLSGYVRDINGQAIADAEIYITELEKLEITKDDGSFSFENINEGVYTLLTFSLGFTIEEQTIAVNQETTPLLITLKDLGEELSEVVLTQQREKLFALRKLKSVEGTAIYDSKKSEVVLIDKITGNLAANNARQIYSQVVGLNIYDNADAGLQLNIGGRGLDPNRTTNFNTRQNGYDISADALGYPESYYTPPAEALNEIQVVRGAASLQYGTQFGGLLNFVFKKPNPNKKIEWVSRQTAGSFGLLTSFNSISGILGKFSYYTYFNYKEGSSFRPNSDFNSRNYFGSFGYQFTDKTKLTFEATIQNYLAQQAGGITDLQFETDPTFSNRTRNWFDVDWNLFNLKLEHKFSSKTDFSLSLFTLDASRTALGIRDNVVTSVDDFSETRELLIDDFLNWGAEARLLTRYKIKNQDAVFLIGSKYYQSDNNQTQGPGTNGTGPDFEFAFDEFPGFARQASFDTPNFNIAVFGENIFNLTDKWSVVPGFRFEHIQTEVDGAFNQVITDLAGNVLNTTEIPESRNFVRNFVLLGVGTTFKLNNSVEFYGNISENFRSVTFSDIFIDNVSFDVDENITDEEGFSLDIGARGRLKNIFSYDVSLFGLSYRERLGQRNAVRTAGVGSGADVQVRTNVGDAFIYGLESFVDWNLKETFLPKATHFKLNVFANVALTQSEYTSINDFDLEDQGFRPPAGGDTNADVEVGNQVEFIPDINIKMGVNFGYKNFLASFQYTYLSEQFTDAGNTPADTGSGNITGIFGEIPAYGILDLSASYSYKNWKLEAGINNLLDESFFVRRATGYPGPGIIPSEPITFYTTLQFKL